MVEVDSEQIYMEAPPLSCQCHPLNRSAQPENRWCFLFQAPPPHPKAGKAMSQFSLVHNGVRTTLVGGF